MVGTNDCVVPKTLDSMLTMNAAHKNDSSKNKKFIDQNWVPRRLEDYLQIDDWKEQKTYYKKSASFSDTILFNCVFHLLTLWEILASVSRVHKNRFDEIKTSSLAFYQTKDSELGEQAEEGVGKRAKRRPGIYATFYFLFYITCEIEVISNDVNIKTKFPIRPPCFMQSDAVKELYRENIDITDSNRKMTGIMRMYKVFSLSMITDLYFYRNFKLLHMLLSRELFERYKQFIWFLTLITNILLMINIEYDSTTGHLYHKNSLIHDIRLVLSFVVVILSIIVLFTWTTMRLQIQQLEKEEYFKIEHPTRNENHPLWSAKITLLDAFFREGAVVSMLVHMICGIIELFHHDQYFVNALNLFMIYNISKTVKSVCHAIIKHQDQLAMSLMFMFFFIYFFAIIILEYFQNQLWDEDQQIECTSLINCFVYTQNLGLRGGGGIGDYFKIQYPSQRFYYSQFALEFIFFLLINIIFQNVIFGIIVDTFSQLRNNNEKFQDDTENICFVCGLSRSDFSKGGKNYEEHINHEHDPWKYVYFIHYLDEKGEDSLTGMEQACWDDFMKLKTEWFPIGQTLYQGIDDSNMDNFRNLKAKMDKLQRITNERFDHLSGNIEKIMNKLDIPVESFEPKEFGRRKSKDLTDTHHLSRLGSQANMNNDYSSSKRNIINHDSGFIKKRTSVSDFEVMTK